MKVFTYSMISRSSAPREAGVLIFMQGETGPARGGGDILRNYSSYFDKPQFLNGMASFLRRDGLGFILFIKQVPTGTIELP